MYLLDADAARLLIHRIDRWVHLYVQLPILLQLSSPFLQLLFNPVFKWLSTNREDQVGDVLSVQILDLLFLHRQGLIHLRVLLRPLQHLFNA